MGFASFNFSEYGNSVQNILVSLEIEFLDYAVGFMCVSLSRPLWSVSPSALRLRPLSPSRILPPQSSRPFVERLSPSRPSPTPSCAPVHGRPRAQPSPRPAGAVPTRRARFLVRSGTSYFRSDRTHEFVWWKWKVGHAMLSDACRPHTQWVPHTYTYDEYDTFQYFLVDGYKQYAHRYLISDFLLFADNVNQPDLLPFSHRCFLAIPLHHR